VHRHDNRVFLFLSIGPRVWGGPIGFFLSRNVTVFLRPTQIMQTCLPLRYFSSSEERRLASSFFPFFLDYVASFSSFFLNVSPPPVRRVFRSVSRRSSLFPIPSFWADNPQSSSRTKQDGPLLPLCLFLDFVIRWCPAHAFPLLPFFPEQGQNHPFSPSSRSRLSSQRGPLITAKVDSVSLFFLSVDGKYTLVRPHRLPFCQHPRSAHLFSLYSSFPLSTIGFALIEAIFWSSFFELVLQELDGKDGASFFSFFP